MKKIGNKKRIFQFFFFFLLIVFVVSGVILTIRLIELRQGNDFYQQSKETRDMISLVSYPSAISEIPKKEEQETEQPDFPQYVSQFQKQYPNAVAWLQIPNTAVDYPVMLGDDNQFYLDHLPNGNKNALGSLFLDFRTQTNSDHVIVYGHDSSNGKMFGTLEQYESPEYYADHPAISFVTPNTIYVCPIFSVRIVEEDSEAYQLEFQDQNSLAEYIRQAAQSSLYPIDFAIYPGARILTLSTCTNVGDQRLIVQAILPSK